MKWPPKAESVQETLKEAFDKQREQALDAEKAPFNPLAYVYDLTNPHVTTLLSSDQPQSSISPLSPCARTLSDDVSLHDLYHQVPDADTDIETCTERNEHMDNKNVSVQGDAPPSKKARTAE